jgi:hypothetical protein
VRRERDEESGSLSEPGLHVSAQMEMAIPQDLFWRAGSID